MHAVHPVHRPDVTTSWERSRHWVASAFGMAGGYRSGPRSRSDRERVAAGALVRGPRVLHLEAAAEQRGVELQRRPLDDRGAAGIDEHAHAAGARDDVVLGRSRVVETQLV